MFARENDSDETTMIPDGLIPRQRSDDPIAAEDPAAEQGGINGDRPLSIDGDRPVDDDDDDDDDDQEEHDDDAIELDELP